MRFAEPGFCEERCGALRGGQQTKSEWFRPLVQAAIEYGSITDDGLLREAVFKGLRDDLPVA
jgi:ATP-dependent DNA ligase